MGTLAFRSVLPWFPSQKISEKQMDFMGDLVAQLIDYLNIRGWEFDFPWV